MSLRPGRQLIQITLACGLACCAMLTLACVRASAVAPPRPAWQITTAGLPTVLPSGVGRHGKYDVVVENIGGVSSEGVVTVKDRLPAGLSVTATLAEPAEGCTEAAHEVTCSYPNTVVPSGFIVMNVQYVVTGPVAALTNVVTVSGGGGREVTSENDTGLGVAPGAGPAGIAEFRAEATGPAGEEITQAGAHPNFFTTSVVFNNMVVENAPESESAPVEAVKDLVFYLPLGMLGNATAAAPCPSPLVETTFEATGCPPGSRVGAILPMILNNVYAHSADPTLVRGVYNIPAEKGYAAEFAFASNHIEFVTYASVVRHHGTYMVRVSTPGITPSASLIGLVATFYGDIKSSYIVNNGEGLYDYGAFLTDPADCGASEADRSTSVVMNTWEHPYALPVAETTAGFSQSKPSFPNLQGCGLLGLTAGLSVTPETTQADAPSGYEIGLTVPQAPNTASTLGTPPVKDVSVTLPAGSSISPSSANGLEACAETGPHGIDIEGPESEEVAADGLERPTPGHCPRASQIATVIASTPLLREDLTGHLFVASPECGGQEGCTMQDAEDGKLFGLYLELEGPNSGVIVKLKGHATVQAGTGQITASFDEGPQFPFSKLTVSMKSGSHAPLANAQTCGTAASTAVVTPWSSPSTPDATAGSTFGVDWNGSGEACPATAPFAPTFTAGTTVPAAASTSPFTLTLRREDREQDIDTLSTTLPKGLLADLSKVGRCPEPQASTASLTACPASSQIGTTTVAVGSGSDPYYVTGRVFFTGPYGDAPFGLSVLVPAVAGPFNLGTVLVRVKLFVDPRTSQVTAVSDPLPQERDGVPLRMRVLNVSLENADFVLNPTNCSKTSITGTVHSPTGGQTAISSPFAVVGCKNLPFKPALSISTDALATKTRGTGVRAKISYPSAGQANVAKVVIGFPKQLPVRLETLQRACRATVFETNPAACPVASDIGMAVAHTPILASPLTGPVYLVSYGNAKFPDVVFVLQGEGITLEVDGQSFVSKTGALKVTFASVPDAPFASFETTLPPGRFSQFTSVRTVGKARGSQCGEKLVAPVRLIGQNGRQVAEKRHLKVVGCRSSVSHSRRAALSHARTKFAH